VLPEPDPFAIDAITTKEFKWQMEMISSYFRVISLEQLLQEMTCGKLYPHTVCITFDDGYQDNFEYAFPILRHYNLPATIFLTSDLIDTKEMLWHDVVLQTIKATKNSILNFEKANIINVNVRNDENRRQVAIVILQWLKQFSPVDRDNFIQNLMNTCGIFDPTVERLMLNWQEIRQMYKAGISFGAHTKTHPILSLLSGKEIEEEITGSKEMIEQELNTKVISFAYPNGKPSDFDERCKNILEKTGFAFGLTTCWGANTIHTDKYALLRSRPWDHHPDLFLGRLLVTRFSS